MESLSIITDAFTKVNGPTTRGVAEDMKSFQMAILTMALMRIIKPMERESISGRMGRSTMVSG